LLAEFGGGIELSMLAAIPKGSGLGTSSILAGTILGVLGEICSHNWTGRDIFSRTSVLEQILTSGGGWQDQVGGITAGVKLTTTHADISQTPDIRWLPDVLLQDDIVSGRALLYYTGITRLARNILGEIVQEIFLNNRRTIATIEDIAYNADFTADAIQRNDGAALREAIRRSWKLNCTLDGGTCPRQVQDIVDRIAPFNTSFKLLGAGGGGYMLILAPDLTAAAAVKETLQMNPTNPRARFVSMEISQTGMQITRS
jgi:galactokinase/mevalonate kinase-like predicted kinase